MVSDRNDQDVRQVTCLEVQSPRHVFVKLPEQYREILLSFKQTQIDEGFFHLPMIQYPVDLEIRGADQHSSDPCFNFQAQKHASWQSRMHGSAEGSWCDTGRGYFNGILTRSCPCRTC